ncbi:hypothetical protein HN51_065648 [Arachis hypogaea]|uniref:C2 domain-containing protein n=1 Tax=Arachis hypogaea TaxID=3818 RepID=A0A445DIH3_ARAHY|nr:protein SRC2 [Arachis ipaensis]XP_025646637.1 protein SRC2 [Arachis hypogaea]XP_025694674.1 protein SRC2 [Arachis hypogaea]QHO06861.1 hypothetical protein DS421_14g458510 [Arachis hypogaea]QHO38014.1 hypothetical protein DS421_4g116640 [Arachis hypogaea]RYR13204.1 hypothetical protein Ahy_B04g070317 isoform B [Arachis hypogaea]RYR62995.1 hypothetical protein Ahy_A04g020773 [Arachis hypogaea]
MEYRTLDLMIVSAKDLKNVNLISKMDVYAVVSLNGDIYNPQKFKTSVDRDGGTSPTWNFPMKFNFSDSLAQQNRLSLEIKIVSDRTLGDTLIGTVHVPLRELLDNPGGKDGKEFRQVSYQVRKPSGKPKGSLNFSYKVGGKSSAAPAMDKASSTGATVSYAPPPPKTAEYPPPATAYPPPSKDSKNEPVMAYPAHAAGAAGSSSAPYAYPPPHQQYPAGHGYPPAGYPPQQGYGGYGYPPQQPGYGYPPQGYGYPGQAGYGYSQPPQKPKKNKNNFGMGLGAGLLGGALGGLLIGDMVSDAADYDAGYDAGFDDAGGFDF